MKRCIVLLLVGWAWTLFECRGAAADLQPADEEPLPLGALHRFGSTHLRHGSGIVASDLSPDGKLLATMSDRSVVLWDVAREKRLRSFSTPRGYCWPGSLVLFSPNGRWLACLAWGRFIYVWEVPSGRMTLNLSKPPQATCPSLQFTLDSGELRILANSCVSSYNPGTGRLIASLERPLANLLLPDGKSYLQYENSSKNLIIRDLQSNKALWRAEFTVTEFDLDALGGTIAADAKSIALLDLKRGIEIRELATGKKRVNVPIPASYADEVKSYVDSPWHSRMVCQENLVFLSTVVGATTYCWAIPSGKELGPISDFPWIAYAGGIHFRIPGPQLILADQEGRVHLLSAGQGFKASMPKGFVGRIAANVSRNGRLFAISDDKQVYLWNDLENPKKMTPRKLPLPQPGRASCVAFSPDSKVLGLATSRRTILLELHSGEKKEIWLTEAGITRGPQLYMSSFLDFHPNGTSLIAKDSLTAPLLVNLAKEQIEEKSPNAFAIYSHTGRYLAAIRAEANQPASLCLLDAFTWKLLRTSKVSIPPSNRPPAITFSPDDRQVLVGIHNQIIFLDVQHGNELRRIEVEGSQTGPELNEIQSLAFSPDGMWLLSGGTDGLLRLIDVPTGNELLRIEGHEGDIRTVAFGPNGTTAISAATDGLAYLWDLRPKAPKPNPSLDELWHHLGSDDPRLAYQSIWAMRDRAKEASVFLRNKLPPVKPVEKTQLERLIKDLDNSQFKQRQAAFEELDKIGDQAASALEEALAKSPPLETRQRLQRLLERMRQSTTPELLRLTRAVQAMSLAGTPEALATLRSWAKGAPEARLSRLSQAAVRRLEAPLPAK